MFGWFHKSEKPKIVHEDLGGLVLERGYWWGELHFPPAGVSVQLSITDVGGKPAPCASEIVRELGVRYADLRPALAAELRGLFAPWYDEFWEGSEPMQQGEPLLQRFDMSAVDIEANGDCVIEFVLKEGWDEAGFRVSLKDWVPKGLGVDD